MLIICSKNITFDVDECNKSEFFRKLPLYSKCDTVNFPDIDGLAISALITQDLCEYINCADVVYLIGEQFLFDNTTWIFESHMNIYNWSHFVNIAYTLETRHIETLLECCWDWFFVNVKAVLAAVLDDRWGKVKNVLAEEIIYNLPQAFMEQLITRDAHQNVALIRIYKFVKLWQSVNNVHFQIDESLFTPVEGPLFMQTCSWISHSGKFDNYGPKIAYEFGDTPANRITFHHIFSLYKASKYCYRLTNAKLYIYGRLSNGEPTTIFVNQLSLEYECSGPPQHHYRLDTPILVSRIILRLQNQPYPQSGVRFDKCRLSVVLNLDPLPKKTLFNYQCPHKCFTTWMDADDNSCSNSAKKRRVSSELRSIVMEPSVVKHILLGYWGSYVLTVRCSVILPDGSLCSMLPKYQENDDPSSNGYHYKLTDTQHIGRGVYVALKRIDIFAKHFPTVPPIRLGFTKPRW